MTSSNPPYTISFLPPPGPAVFSLPSSSSSQPPVPSASASISQTFHDAIAIREVVFVDEQHGPAGEEIDIDDPISWHWVLYVAGSIPAANIRLIPAQAHANADDEKGVGGPRYEHSELWDGKEPYLQIGRLATRREFRGRGYARVLIEEALGWAGGHPADVVGDWRGEGGEKAVWKGLLLIHAQERLDGWYGNLGWRTDKGLGRWDEVGIWHVGMWKRVEIKG